MTNYINPFQFKEISKNQEYFRMHQIIQGTILGGSSLILSSKGLHTYLSMRSANRKWLDFKASELELFAGPRPIIYGNTNRWHSLCFPMLNDLRNLFYNGKERCLTVETLNGLCDVAIMIWFGDAGKFQNGKLVFNTHLWGEQGTEAIQQYFQESLLDAEILKERGRFRVRLSEKASRRLYGKSIAPHLPSFFQNFG